MASFWERATGHGDGAANLLDLNFFQLALELYSSDVVPPSFFEAGELALDTTQLQELTTLLGLMPAGAGDRVAWVTKVVAVCRVSRLLLADFDTLEKSLAALGVEP